MMRCRALLAAGLMTSSAFAAEAVSIGVKGGVPLTDAFEVFNRNAVSYAVNTKRYLVGPTVEFHLPLRLSLEVDALYKRLGYQYSNVGTQTFARTVINSWEFPVLGKWEILPGPMRPFVDLGASFRHLSGVSQVRSVAGAVGVQVNAAEFNRSNDIGLAAGFGIAFKAGPVRISPEFRYTHWGTESFRDPVNALLRTRRDQGDFLLGLTF